MREAPTDWNNKDCGVEAAKLSRAEVTEATKRGLVMDLNGCLGDSKESLWEGPEEVSRPDLRELRGVRVDAQEPRNLLAHLLNRGSSLE